MGQHSLPIRFGIAISVCLMAYFLILSLLGLHSIVFQSLFNVVITGFGTYGALKFYRLRNPENFGYASGL